MEANTPEKDHDDSELMPVIEGISERVPSDDDALDDAMQLTKIMQELGDDGEENDAFVIVYRETKTETRKPEKEYLERFPAESFAVELLRENFGPGKYYILVYRGGGRGLAARKNIRIGKGIEKKQDAAPQDILAPVLQTMQAGFEKMASILAESKKPEQPAGQTRSEILGEMQIMRELFERDAPPPVQQTQQQINPIEMLKLGMEMAQNAGAEGNSVWLNKMLDQFGPLLAAKLSEAPVLGGPETARAGRISAPDQNLERELGDKQQWPAPQIDEEVNSVNIIVAQYLNMLKKAAEKRASVEDYAESVLQAIPGPELEDLEKMLSEPDWKEQLAKHTNAVQLYPEWFGRLRDTLLQYIREDREAQGQEVSDNASALTPGALGDSVLPHDTGTSTNDNGSAS